MGDNKYYTPTIEEFHVGFEYEIMAFDGEDALFNGTTKNISELRRIMKQVGITK
jgi:hypothetical protein